MSKFASKARALREKYTPAKKPVVLDIPLIILSNTPVLGAESLLQMFYNGAIRGQIGLMYAKNKEDKVVPLLVGMRYEDGQVKTFPLAECLNFDTAKSYLAPDGKGGWTNEFGDDEVAEDGPSE